MRNFYLFWEVNISFVVLNVWFNTVQGSWLLTCSLFLSYLQCLITIVNLIHQNLLRNGTTDSPVKEKILTNVRIMDELARRLDQPIYRGEQEPPIVQHWKNLAVEFRVAEDVVTRCQTNPQSSPSKHMFEFLEAGNPNFSVKELKDGLSFISRNDLVKKMKQCGLAGEFL